MRGFFFRVALAVALCAGAAGACAQPVREATIATRLPLVFEVNEGQADARARFVARGRGVQAFLTDGGVVLSLREAEHTDVPVGPRRRHGTDATPWVSPWLDAAARDSDASSAVAIPALALRYRVAAASPHPRVEGVDPLPGRSNYLIGNDRNGWHTGIAQYRGVRYRDVLPGVSLVYYGKDGQLEFDVEVESGVDLADVRLRIDGADALALGERGDLVIHTALGELIQRKPVVYQTVAGERRELRGEYVLFDQDAQGAAHEVAFAVRDFDRRVALVLDPALDFGTYFGGAQYDDITGIKVDANGDIYFAGSTISDAGTFPETVGAYQTMKKAFFDAYVAKMRGDGSALVYATYIGGGGNDFGNALAVDPGGQAVLGGETTSSDYPVVNAAQGGRDTTGTTGIVTKLDGEGDDVVFSTYMGGNSVTQVFAIATDQLAATYVTGRSINSTFPTTAGAFQTTVSSPGGSDAFVVKYDATGNRVYATLLGAGGERADGIAADSSGNAYLAGTISAAAIHGVTANLIGPGGNGDAMIAKLNATGTALLYLTRIGGSSAEQAVGVTVDAAGNAFFTGNSASSDLPSASAAPGGTYVALFGALNVGGTALAATGLTWYGPTVADATCVSNALGGAFGSRVIIDPLDPNVVYVVGYGCPVDAFPFVNPVAGLTCAPDCASDHKSLDSFLLRFTLAPAPLLDSATPIADSAHPTTGTFISDFAVDPVGRVVLGGGTDGSFALPNALDALPNGGEDALLLAASFAVLPPLVTKAFAKTDVDNHRLATFNLTIKNENLFDALTGVSLIDVLPACMRLADRQTIGCNAHEMLFADTNLNRLRIYLDDALLPQSSCSFEVTVFTEQAGDCRNETQHVLSNQGTGNAAAATLSVMLVPEFVWNAPAGSGSADTGIAGNWYGNLQPSSGGNITFPADTETDVNNTLEETFNFVRFSASGFAVSGEPLVLTGGIENTGINTVSSLIHAGAPIAFINDTVDSVLHLSGGLASDGDEFTTLGNGLSVYDAPIVQAVRMKVTEGSSADVMAAASLVEFVVAGSLRGCSSCGDVTVDVTGDFHPCEGTAPCISTVSSLTCDGGTIELDCGPGNTVCSALHAAGPVVSECDEISFNLQNIPSVGSTFANVIQGNANSGCPENVYSPFPGVLLDARCSATAVSLKAIAVDAVFHSGF